MLPMQAKKAVMYEELRGMVELASRRATTEQVEASKGTLRRLDLREEVVRSRCGPCGAGWLALAAGASSVHHARLC